MNSGLQTCTHRQQQGFGPNLSSPSGMWTVSDLTLPVRPAHTFDVMTNAIASCLSGVYAHPVLPTEFSSRPQCGQDCKKTRTATRTQATDPHGETGAERELSLALPVKRDLSG